jgi:Conserved hypothetical ATP binding protein
MVQLRCQAALRGARTAAGAWHCHTATQSSESSTCSRHRCWRSSRSRATPHETHTATVQVMALVEKRHEPPLETVVVDTAGQIEIFTWSASGNIVTELFASSFPTVVLYVVDTPRCLRPQTFMSNMMQACSILYKTRLPMVLVRGPRVPCSALLFASMSDFTGTGLAG